MFMNSNLTLQHLSLFGGMTNAISTEIGGDQRSIFVQPITAAGETKGIEASDYAAVTPAVKLPAAYDDWLQSTRDYSDAASQSDSAAGSSQAGSGAGSAGSAGAAQTVPADAVAETVADVSETPPTTTNGDETSVATTIETAPDTGSNATVADGSTNGTASNNSSGGLLGGMLGGLFGR